MEFIDIVEWSSLIISKSLKNHPPISQKSGSIAASNSLACMYVLRGINIRLIWAFAWKAMLGYIAWSSFIYLLYAHLGCKFLAIPFLPVATIGTAVAFYVGFKNNSAYDRLWEGRRIWGSITNASRTFANWIINWSGQWEGKSVADMEAIRREIVLRHIAWANVLRLQLRRTSVWENHYATTITNKMIHTTTPEEQFEEDIRHLTEDLLGKDEFSTVKTKGNKATYLLFLQSQQLTALKHRGLLSNFEHSDLEKWSPNCTTSRARRSASSRSRSRASMVFSVRSLWYCSMYCCRSRSWGNWPNSMKTPFGSSSRFPRSSPGYFSRWKPSAIRAKTRSKTASTTCQ